MAPKNRLGRGLGGLISGGGVAQATPQRQHNFRN